jgi:hypothetical protein
VAARLGIAPDEVVASLRELAAQDVIALRPGTEEPWLVHPFCATPGPFRVLSGERAWDAICVWDALGILALAEVDGSVETSCPDCSEPLRIEVDDGDVGAPPEVLVHFGVPARSWYADIGYT